MATAPRNATQREVGSQALFAPDQLVEALQKHIFLFPGIQTFMLKKWLLAPMSHILSSENFVRHWMDPRLP